MNWKSFALWPIEADVRTSDDKHPTREHAIAVCKMLKRGGLGGLGKIFPTQVFVEDPKGNVTVV
jgi:hypothetical protein